MKEKNCFTIILLKLYQKLQFQIDDDFLDQQFDIFSYLKRSKFGESVKKGKKIANSTSKFETKLIRHKKDNK